MLRAAIAFFVLALVSFLLGATGFAGLSMDIGKILITVFLIISVLAFLASLLTGRRSNIHI